MKILATTAALFLATSVCAHEAPIHEHTELVPIPAYELSYGPASGAAALRAVEAFLARVDADTKAQFMFALDSPIRTKWSNLPAGIVDRSGISVGELDDEQRKLLFAFLASSLGQEGYESVAEVMAAETFLSTDRRAKRLQWAPENYWLSIYGTPDANAPWGWQFGGHHLGLNISIEGNRVETMSPTFVGTEPAIFTVNGTDYEAVRDMHLSGYAVYTALDEAQQAAAHAGKVPEDVLTGPGNDGRIPSMIGLSASEMTGTQRAALLTAINEWVSIQPDENAKLRMAELAEGLEEISFAWVGTDEVNTPTYMRIQGPTLIIEMLSTGGNVGSSAQGAGHYHTMYRNPTKDYGK
ncbi:DUF3500 domain-containing protein [Shimia sp. MMG029]|uniref:DUF3500 domain-containing protein n=1 Tax=Shimia sp. MMG029 TaxID=3021978 RepID=UPI0022FE3621|nr:DUF3500 domain-containing protein [Shimia sp. MMG029]MDA5557744.1 DUF3500 domain-containing protein [Shimia sp. MMG029]